MKIQHRSGLSSARLGIEALEDRCVPATLSISDATVTEFGFSNQSAALQVTLSEPTKKPVSVNYATNDGTATAGKDYSSVSGTVSFAKGQTVKTIYVSVISDHEAEFDETFTVRLSGAKGATIADGVGVVTIKDAPPSVTIWAHPASEGDGYAYFSVQLSFEYDLPVTVQYSTFDGTAVAGQDYVATSGTVTFAPGETVKFLAIPLIADTIQEADQVFHINVVNSSLWFDWDNSWTEVSIADDD